MIWALHTCFNPLAHARGSIYVFVVAWFLIAAGAVAGTVSGKVELVSAHDSNARKHTDYSGVVVWLEPLSGTPVLPASAVRAQMVQKNKSFNPHVLAITVGT